MTLAAPAGGGRLLGRRRDGNAAAVRVRGRAVKAPLELADDAGFQDVLDFLGVLMHMVGTVLRRAREVEFPEPMIADQFGRAPQSTRGEAHVAAVDPIARGEPMARQVAGAAVRVGQGLTPLFGELAE